MTCIGQAAYHRKISKRWAIAPRSKSLYTGRAGETGAIEHRKKARAGASIG
jgi:hypothetical protein